jgi:hypothetical protein
MIGSFGGRKLFWGLNLVQDIVGTLEHQCKPVVWCNWRLLSSLQKIKISFPDCREFGETTGTND